MTILVIGGGGGFARVLRDSGVAESIGRLWETAHLSPLLYGWLVSASNVVPWTSSRTVAAAPPVAGAASFNEFADLLFANLDGETATRA